MRPKLTIGQFYSQFKKSLRLSFLTTQVGLDSRIKLSLDSTEVFEIVDYLNIVRPSNMVVIGKQEADYLKTLSDKKQQNQFRLLHQGIVTSFIISSEAQISDSLIAFSEQNNIPIFKSGLTDAYLLDNCRYFLSRALAERTTEHGVFIEVSSVGIFIRGASGMGKSELALALISRGHRLVADDATEFQRTGPETIEGHSPALLADFMEVRGLGIVNIRAMFGSNSIKRNKTLRLIVNLSKYTEENKHQFDRLGLDAQTHTMLGIEIPEITLPVASGRNLAVLVETAARNHLLHMNGYNAAEDFIVRQREAIEKNEQ